jgi:SAM-dependent methyltransferase
MGDSPVVDHVTGNQRLWDVRIRAHLEAGLYPIEEFRRTGSTLSALEVDELGDVYGRSLLHLQCNGGLDTLSWARRGARVTGVDFSAVGIDTARSLAAELGIDARFILSDVYATADVCDDTFDIVFTSGGVLWWLPDLARWAQVIAALLRPGGAFYIAELHPFAMTLAEEDGRIVVKHDYFSGDAPLVFESSGTYYEAGPDFATEPMQEVGWIHSLAEVVTALLGAGLVIDFLHEHPFTIFRMLPSFTKCEDGTWRPATGPQLPLLFSLRAHLPQ